MCIHEAKPYSYLHTYDLMYASMRENPVVLPDVAELEIQAEPTNLVDGMGF